MARGRKLESLKDYQRALKNKYGIGQGTDYKPWFRIEDVKSHGTKSLIFGRKTNRDHHMLSGIESEHFYLAEFSDRVIDIREQFPILPLNYTQKVAKTLGIEHPKHPKTKEHIILTTDQLLTLHSPQGNSFHAVSVKPESESDKLRILEKIDIERVCWELLGVNFSYFTGNELTKCQSQNIHWATSPFRENPLIFSQEQIDCALSSINLGQCFIEDFCNQLILINAASNEEALSMVRFLIANKHIDVDLTFNIPESGILNVKKINVDRMEIVNGIL
tara:strand:+ start:115 stop:942 length:828 start_codon:yes stop_codon:yes gene_type:complete